MYKTILSDEWTGERPNKQRRLLESTFK